MVTKQLSGSLLLNTVMCLHIQTVDAQWKPVGSVRWQWGERGQTRSAVFHAERIGYVDVGGLKGHFLWLICSYWFKTSEGIFMLLWSYQWIFSVFYVRNASQASLQKKKGNEFQDFNVKNTVIFIVIVHILIAWWFSGCCPWKGVL